MRFNSERIDFVDEKNAFVGLVNSPCLDPVVRRRLKPSRLKRVVPYVAQKCPRVCSGPVDIGGSLFAIVHNEELWYQHVLTGRNVAQRDEKHSSGDDTHYRLIDRKRVTDDCENNHHRKHIPELDLLLRFPFV